MLELVEWDVEVQYGDIWSDSAWGDADVCHIYGTDVVNYADIFLKEALKILQILLLRLHRTINLYWNPNISFEHYIKN